jgi:heat-inducible transcriptional repressor
LFAHLILCKTAFLSKEMPFSIAFFLPLRYNDSNLKDRRTTMTIDRLQTPSLVVEEKILLQNAETMKKILAGAKGYELHIGGTENLLSYPEFSDIETARGFIGMLSTRENILEALLANRPSDGIEIRIGAENGLFNSPHASLITLFCDDKFPVMLGLMGPTRMDYARTIAGCNHVLAHLKTFIEREY